jgi:ornithine cyclodeaminase/alanine dehydrogenase-like protein (mu-crystallin family)
MQPHHADTTHPTRLLTKADVADLMDLSQAMACLEDVFRQQGGGTVTAWPPAMMRTAKSHLIMRSGGLAEMQRQGVRISVGPRGRDFALLFDTVDRALLCLMAFPFTELRLSAASGLGVQVLARPEARKLAVLGTGRNAPGIAEAICKVRPIDTIQVYSPTPEHRKTFADRVGTIAGFPVEAKESGPEAVAGADIVVVCTSATKPALYGDWLAPNALVVAVGNRPEVDRSVFERADLVVTTSKVQEMNVHEISDDWPLVQLMQADGITLDEIAELSDVMAGRVTVPDGITVFREAQGGYTDIAMAVWLYERAVALGRGVDFTIA